MTNLRGAIPTQEMNIAIGSTSKSNRMYLEGNILRREHAKSGISTLEKHNRIKVNMNVMTLSLASRGKTSHSSTMSDTKVNI